MAHFSRLQITLHWLTLLLTGIAYAAIELRGWAPKGSSVYLFMKDTYRALSHFSRLTAAGRRDDGVRREKLELFWFYCTGIFDAR